MYGGVKKSYVGIVLAIAIPLLGLAALIDSCNTLYARTTAPAYLPNPRLTPGDILPVTIFQTEVPGYAKKARDVSASMKKKVYKAYGIENPLGDYKVDHLIPLKIGGSNEFSNLWPHAYRGKWNTYMKFELEMKFQKMTINRELSLSQAQKEISTNWVEAYKKYIGPGEKSKHWNR